MYAIVKMDQEKCTRCSLCIFSCPEPNVFKFNKDKKEITIKESRCKGCGLCITTCPKEALSLGLE